MTQEVAVDELMAYNVRICLMDGQRLIYCLADARVANDLKAVLREPTDPAAIPGIGKGFLSISVVDNRTVFVRMECINYVVIDEELAGGVPQQYNDNFGYLPEKEEDAILPDVIFKFKHDIELFSIDDLTGQFIPDYLNDINEDYVKRACIELEDNWGDLRFIYLNNVLCIEVENAFIQPLDSDG